MSTRLLAIVQTRREISTERKKPYRMCQKRWGVAMEEEPLSMRIGLGCVAFMLGVVLFPFVVWFAFFGSRDD